MDCQSSMLMAVFLMSYQNFKQEGKGVVMETSCQNSEFFPIDMFNKESVPKMGVFQFPVLVKNLL